MGRDKQWFVALKSKVNYDCARGIKDRICMLFIRSEEVDNISKPLSSHFWVGSFCCCCLFPDAETKDDPILSYPSE
jgi:hypothetical protein